MKKLIFSSILLIVMIITQAQSIKEDQLQNLEKSQSPRQEQKVTATLKSASRLFGMKDDLTSALMVIPTGSVVTITGSDSTYYKVTYEESEGYIFKRDAVINKTAPVTTTAPPKENVQNIDQQAAQGKVDRFTYLENKYGTSMANKLMAGKIWKGMSAQMVKDSWGTPLKVNRDINDVVKEEWVYKKTWLYFENNKLLDWGPVQN
jgi:uncharacterized protein YxeA